MQIGGDLMRHYVDYLRRNYSLGSARIGVIGVLTLAALMTTTGCRKEEVSTTAEALRLILKYNKQGKSDKAIEIALERLRIDPTDVDVHATVALIYLEKAETDGIHRDELINEALRHVNRAFELAPDSLRVLSPSVAAFERAGDISTTTRCDRYDRALQFIEREKAIESQYLNSEPRTSADKWDDVIRMDDGKRARIKQKMLNARCK